ncbi:PIG-L deacetylase family protein [Rubritalea tangerina]|uniref:PIG-L deacetylase family protein n=1 Tax=Rubritalea tangerina TaxID=430798 RepID=A0ABW4ZAP4_9BACT
MQTTERRVLVVAAHADDEILGCGGTMAKHVSMGDKVGVLFMTDGVGARSDECDTCHVEGRESAAHQALEIIGAELLGQFAFPDNAMDQMARIEITQAIERVITEYQPTIIYTHHGGDLNVDHRRTLESVLTASRPQPGNGVCEIYSFEVASSTAWKGVSLTDGFLPNYYVNISDQLDVKMEALKAYEDEMRDFPHARSYEALEALALWRGSQVGLRAAEAFMVERKILF